LKEAAASFGVSPSMLSWQIRKRRLPPPEFDPHCDERCDLKLWPLGLRVADVVVIRRRLDAGGDVNEIADDHCISVRVVLALRDLFPGDVLGLDGKPPPMYFRFDGGELQAV